MSRGMAAHIAAVRRFNRFYTRLIGVLDRTHLQSAYSLAEMRVLYELAHRPGTTAGELAKDLALDPGYLSRILNRFTRERLLRRVREKNDRRRTLLSLTAKGERVFDMFDESAREHVQALIGSLTPKQRKELVAAMGTIERLLTPPA
jgi:DNA-binding MarR family transcriptional regulator